jgi:large subunit ribosomal protein L9
MKVERRQVVLDRPIKTLGIHKVRIALHPEVSVSVDVNVARSEAEAEAQANPEAATAFFEREGLGPEGEQPAPENPSAA